MPRASDTRSARPRASVGIALAAITLGASAARAQILDPFEVSSRSGAWTLAVNPGVPQGGGPCAYALRRDGAVVWEAQLPCTLWEAAVADDGRAFGVAYTRGWDGLCPPGDGEPADELVVVGLDARGEVRWQERLSRAESPFLHGIPTPWHRGCFLQPELDRFVVRLVDSFGAAERWRAYRTSTGECQLEACPDALQPRPQLLGSLLGARPVEGTPLVVAHWKGRVSGALSATDSSERLALLDAELRPVWSFGLPRPSGDPAGWLRLARWRGESLAGEWSPGRFTLRILREARCVTFEVERFARGNVFVRELERVPCAVDVPEAYAVLEAPAVELEELPPRSLGDIDPDFLFVDSRGRIVVQDRRDGRIHAFDATGRHLFRSEPAPTVSNAREPHAAAQRDGSILVELGRGDHVLLGSHGARLGRPRFEGSLLVVRPGTDERWVEREDVVVRLDEAGEERLRLRRGAGGRWLRWVRDLAFSPTGELAVLSTPYDAPRVPARVFLYDADGRAVGALLAAGGIAARLAHGGDWLALDLSSRRGLLIRRRDGECLRFDRAEGMLGRSFFSPDGRELWRFDREPLRLRRYTLPPSED